MELKGSRQIRADRATVWTALNDPEVLKASIPGCSSLTGTPEEGFEATVTQKVGPVKATFKGVVRLSDVVEGERYTIAGEGKGGAAGFAKGAADVRLSDADFDADFDADAGAGAGGGVGTLLEYDVRASVGGKIAQLGSRLIDGFAKKMADTFFENFKAQVEGPEEGPEAVPEAATAADAPADKKPGWMGRVIGRKA